MIAYTVQQDSEVEPDERLQLPPAGSRRDAGAGARLRAAHGHHHPRRGARRAASCPRTRWARSSSASASSSTRASASSKRCARCARSCELWDEITAERYGVTDAKQRRFRYGVQVNSLGLTEQQPENNIIRIVLEMLGGHAQQGCARPRRAAAGVERSARSAAPLGSAVVAARAADPRLRDRPARVRRHLRRQRRGREARGASCATRREREIEDILGARRRAWRAVETGLIKQRLVEWNAARLRCHRDGRADRGRRQRVRRDRALAR